MNFLLSTNDRIEGGWQRNAPTDVAIPSADSIGDISVNVTNSQNTLQKGGSRNRDAYGIADLYGNVAEWVTSPTSATPIAMGGSFASRLPTMTPDWTLQLAPDTQDNKVGFRLVIDE